MEFAAQIQLIVGHCMTNGYSVGQLQNITAEQLGTVIDIERLSPELRHRFVKHAVKSLRKAKALAFKNFLQNELTGENRVALQNAFEDFLMEYTVDGFGDIVVPTYPYGRPERDAELARQAAAEDE